ncbi:MAG: hypothetical protein ACRDH9_02305 [Actinomycetota bacterium]
MSRSVRSLLILTLALPLMLVTGAGNAAQIVGLQLSEFTVDQDALCDIRDQWINDILATHPQGTWAPMKFEPTDSQLDRMGLPSSDILLSRRYPQPTIVAKDGSFHEIPLNEFNASMEAAMDPAVASFAGTGCLGIRPGAFLLLLNGGSVGWCSLAHLYGSSISTAGHCGKGGDVATVIAAVGNHAGVAGPVLLDFGTFKSSTDGGVGNDKALISIKSSYMSIVTPTMCFWGGPRGVYTKTGGTATINWNNGQVSVNPDPFLPQAIVHYGHGAGIGTGGTPRVATSIHWGASHFMFTGAITPGDSGSGANTLTGDAVGANMEAAGIITHIYVDPLMRSGVGIMAGTRATRVGTPTNGQIVPYPVPISGLP